MGKKLVMLRLKWVKNKLLIEYWAQANKDSHGLLDHVLQEAKA